LRTGAVAVVRGVLSERAGPGSRRQRRAGGGATGM